MFNSSNSDACPHKARYKKHNNFTTNSYSYSSDKSDEDKNKVKIPKLIMQTWIDTDIPKKWKISPESIKEKMPDWEYVLMTDKDNRKFVKKHFPDFLPYYDNFPHAIQRADAIRYMWLYIKGGIYMDLDFEVLKPLDEFFTSGSDVYLVSSSNVGSYITNSFMAAKPGCELWLEVIEAMKKPLPFYYLGKHMTVMNSTGPILLTHVVKKSKIVYGVLPSKLILPCSVCNIKCQSKGSYLRQLEGSSWITYDTKFYNFFMCNWRKLIFVIVLIGLLIFIILLINWFEWI